jgi:diaminohydroxyphosphoribosylaminopyrimidine deaminase/5-amino-6-(5-phosphoribosylamino)uracil reductase
MSLEHPRAHFDDLLTQPGTIARHRQDVAAQCFELRAQRGVTRVFAEGGASLAAALLRAGLVQRIMWFHAPAALGVEAMPAIGPLGLTHLAEMPRYRLVATHILGQDVLSEYEGAV